MTLYYFYRCDIEDNNYNKLRTKKKNNCIEPISIDKTAVCKITNMPFATSACRVDDEVYIYGRAEEKATKNAGGVFREYKR